jgi:hypothetical protein
VLRAAVLTRARPEVLVRYGARTQPATVGAA